MGPVLMFCCDEVPLCTVAVHPFMMIGCSSDKMLTIVGDGVNTVFWWSGSVYCCDTCWNVLW